MTSPASQHAQEVAPFDWRKVGLLFVGSGCAALIYEVVWFHLLRLVIGGSSVSMGILLASFMGGMCLGSLAFSRLVPARFHPLKVYAALELGIGLLGCSLPWWLPPLADWYVAVARPSESGIVARAIVAGVCLLPATILMGATLPAIARWVKSTPQGLAQLGVFYGANTFGAVLGCLMAGFVLLPQTDVIYASYFAGAINLLVALAAWAAAAQLRYVPIGNLDSESKTDSAGSGVPWLVCAIVALSGFTALSAEVVWTRLLSLLFGTTTYTFAIILAVFLAGIGIGSTVAAKIAERVERPFRWLALSQLGLVLSIPLASTIITWVLPFWGRPNVTGAFDIYVVFFVDALRTLFSVFPPALFWGATFSFALAAAGRSRGDSARIVGQVYAANTLGAILGSLLTGWLLVNSLGSITTQKLLVTLSGLAALLAFWAERRFYHRDQVVAQGSGATSGSAGAQPSGFALAVPLLLTACAIPLVSAIPHGMLANAVLPKTWDDYEHLYETEGQNTAVAVQVHKGRPERYLCVSGKVVASTLERDLRLQLMLGHLPALLHPQPKKTLTVGLGTGTTAGSFVLYPDVEHINICEIEPAVVGAAGGYFTAVNNDVVNDPRTRLTIDDARHYMATSKEKYDIVTSDPIHPWVQGAAALYSREYYELCKKHLKPGGMVVQWIPLYQTDYDTVACELATFLSAFPCATFWSSGNDPRDGYDLVAIGWAEETKIDLAAIHSQLESIGKLRETLDAVGIGSVPQLFRQYCGNHDTINRTVAGAEINNDRSLKLEYMAGLALFFHEPDAIFGAVTRFRGYPDKMLVNDEEFKSEIVDLLELDDD